MIGRVSGEESSIEAQQLGPAFRHDAAMIMVAALASEPAPHGANDAGLWGARVDSSSGQPHVESPSG
jgi:hypothetical protein